MSEQRDEPPTSPPDTTAQSKGAVEEDHDVTGDISNGLQTLRQELEVALEKVQSYEVEATALRNLITVQAEEIAEENERMRTVQSHNDRLTDQVAKLEKNIKVLQAQVDLCKEDSKKMTKLEKENKRLQNRSDEKIEDNLKRSDEVNDDKNQKKKLKKYKEDLIEKSNTIRYLKQELESKEKIVLLLTRETEQVNALRKLDAEQKQELQSLQSMLNKTEAQRQVFERQARDLTKTNVSLEKTNKRLEDLIVELTHVMKSVRTKQTEEASKEMVDDTDKEKKDAGKGNNSEFVIPKSSACYKEIENGVVDENEADGKKEKERKRESKDDQDLSKLVGKENEKSPAESKVSKCSDGVQLNKKKEEKQTERKEDKKEKDWGKNSMRDQRESRKRRREGHDHRDRSSTQRSSNREDRRSSRRDRTPSDRDRRQRRQDENSDCRRRAEEDLDNSLKERSSTSEFKKIETSERSIKFIRYI